MTRPITSEFLLEDAHVVKGELPKGILLRMEGTIQMADTPNRNKRIYPISVWENLLKEDSEFAQNLKRGVILGELGHPGDRLEVDPKNASHIVRDVWLDGKAVRGVIDVLETPSGRILKTLLEADVKMGVSSRGSGSVDTKDGYEYVQEDYYPEGWDFVLVPSVEDALPEVVAVENKSRAIEVVRHLAEASQDVKTCNRCQDLLESLGEGGCGIKRVHGGTPASQVIEHVNQGGKPEQEKKEKHKMGVEDQRSVVSLEDHTRVQEELTRERSKRENLEEEVERLKAELEASRSLLQASVDRIKEEQQEKALVKSELSKLRTEGEREKSDLQKKYENLKVRYDAAEDLLEESLAMLKEQKAELESIKKERDSLKAESEEARKASVVDYLERELGGLGEEKLKAVLPLFKGVQTVEEAKMKVESLRSVISDGIPRIDPLPDEDSDLGGGEGKSRRIREEVKTTRTNALIRRVNG